MINSEAMTIALSRRLAEAEKRNVQQSMIQTARKMRSETKDKETYSALGEFITCSDDERMVIINTMERMFKNA